MTEHFDTLETRDPEVRERAQLAALPRQIAHAKAHAPAFARILGRRRSRRGDARARRSRSCRSRASRSSLELQKASRPFGGLAATRCGEAPRASSRRPGPIYEPEGRRPDYWRLARALFAAGFRAGRSRPQLLSPITSRRRARCSRPARTRSAARCSPAAPGRPSSRCRRWPTSRPTATSARRRSCGSSSRRPTSMGIALPSLRKALVSARRFRPACAMRSRRAASPATRSTRPPTSGSIAYETEARDGLVVDEGVLVEIVRPGTGDPVAPGEVGEVVVTTLLNTRLSADPLRHRRPVGAAARGEPLRPHQRAHQGLDGPRRPDDQGQGHVRASVAGRGDRQRGTRRSCARGSSSTTPTATTA